MTKSGRVLSGKPVVFSIPIDFVLSFGKSPSLRFWSLLREYSKLLRRELSNSANPGCVAASVLKSFKFFLRPAQLGHTLVMLS